MANYKEVYVKTLIEFIEQIKEFKKRKKKVWYRGHSDNSYKLEPSIYREPYSPESETELLNQFKSRALPHLKNIPDKNDYWEWLFLMQHYKLPTRLLDWSESALIALAFAVIYRTDKNTNGAHIWCLDPLKLNSQFNNLDKNVIPNITENSYAKDLCDKDYTPATGDMITPVAVYGPQNNPRIVGQKGVFTVFPASKKFQYDDYIGDLGMKIIIRTKNQVENIKQELFDLGISESMIFPELDSISSEIKREYITSKK